jgi:hypothetical protein
MTGALLAGLLHSVTAFGAATPEQKCQAAKNVAAGNYFGCRQKAEKALALNGDTTAYATAIARCETAFSNAWQKAIDKADDAGATCFDAPLVANQYKGVIDSASHAVATALEGGGLATCGNGVLEPGEDCDFGTLGGATCSIATASSEPYGKLACGAGCVFDTSGCFPCPGALVAGSCWVVGSDGASCRDTCASNGLAYDSATATYAGSGGSNDQCLAVAQALFPFWISPPAPQPLQVQGIASTGVGCGVFNLPTIVRDGNPTSGDAVDGQIGRICACQ